MKKPVHSSKDDNSRLEKAYKIAVESGNKGAAKRIRRIINQRIGRNQARALEYKKEQSRPQYRSNGPN